MQWNCPHCHTLLAVSDDKLGTGWSFSRCYRCGGFALIRRSELSIIKVDRAPAGENVLLPEASTEPLKSPILGQSAHQNYERYAENAAKTQNSAKNQNFAPSTAAVTMASPAPAQAAKSSTPPPLPTHSPAPGFPSDFDATDFADQPVTPWINRSTLTMAVAVTTLLAAGSGYYVFSEGQALWQKARTAQREASPKQRLAEQPAETAAIARQNSAEVLRPTEPLTPELSTAEPGLAGTIAHVAQAEVTDQVRHQAMAPARVAEPSPLLVKLRGREGKFHSGPGLQYPVIAMAHPETRYVVADWSDRWFKVAVRLPTGTTLAWIRNDQVLVSNEN